LESKFKECLDESIQRMREILHVEQQRRDQLRQAVTLQRKLLRNKHDYCENRRSFLRESVLAVNQEIIEKNAEGKQRVKQMGQELDFAGRNNKAKFFYYSKKID
jgi:hypothetical protein